MAISLRNDASHGYEINHQSAIEMETLVETESNIIGSIREMGIHPQRNRPAAHAGTSGGLQVVNGRQC